MLLVTTMRKVKTSGMMGLWQTIANTRSPCGRGGGRLSAIGTACSAGGTGSKAGSGGIGADDVGGSIGGAGVTGSVGATSTGGTNARGGIPGAGGSNPAGGTTSRGGASGMSGGGSSGDVSATGGITSPRGGFGGDGGTVGSGGSAGSGGAIATGGAKSTGVASATGGTTNATGGATSAGGTNLTGGATGQVATEAGDASVAVPGRASFHCVNWADERDNFVNRSPQPSGLSSGTDTYATVEATAGAVLSGFQTVPARTGYASRLATSRPSRAPGGTPTRGLSTPRWPRTSE